MNRRERPLSPTTRRNSVHAVVPIKDLRHAKSRLAELLSPDERHELVLKMLHDVLATLLAYTPLGSLHEPVENIDGARLALEQIWVISADETVLELAGRLGAQPFLDRTSDLNAALELARQAVTQAQAGAMLVVPADVAAISRSDLDGLLARLAHGADVVIAPNQSRSGTNALGLALPTALTFQFGPNSFAAHLQAAQQLGYNVCIFTSPTLALDIDTPEDLYQLAVRG